MFTPEEIRVIDNIYEKEFSYIKSENYDGSLNIDLFDLYKGLDKEYLVVEQGNIIKEGTLLDCLRYIYKWL